MGSCHDVVVVISSSSTFLMIMIDAREVIFMTLVNQIVFLLSINAVNSSIIAF